MIRVLITEDSDVVATLLRAVIDDQSDMRVVGHARDGREAVQMVHSLRPDLVTMDITMPHMDGFEATRMIMATHPVPIVVISGAAAEELRLTFRALEAGALAVIEKPAGVGHVDFNAIRVRLIDTLRAMAAVPVTRADRGRERALPEGIFRTSIPRKRGTFRLVAVGCSTGGPQALREVLARMPVGFPIPIVIVQHISPGFIHGVVQWLGGSTLLEVTVASDGESLDAGRVYFAPDERHLLVGRHDEALNATLVRPRDGELFAPSVNRLLASVAESCPGEAIGSLLTGMGSDGAQGLLSMRQSGCHTFVQDEASALIYGMPRAGRALGAADQVVELCRMADHLTTLARR